MNDDDIERLADFYDLDAADGSGLAPLLGAGDRPVVLVNYFGLREQAAYPPGSDDEPCTGVEAMLRYSAVSAGRLASVGGRFLHQGFFTSTLWGGPEPWDLVIVAEYPTGDAVVALLRDDEYRAAYRHRRAALDRQLVTASTTFA